MASSAIFMKGFSRDREGCGLGRGGLDGQDLAIAVAAGGRIDHVGEVGLAGFVTAQLGQGTAVREFPHPHPHLRRLSFRNTHG
jgi:hypothetical protein